MKIEKDLTQNEFRVLILGDGTMIMFSSFLSFALQLPTEHFLYKNGPNTLIADTSSNLNTSSLW